MIYVPLYILSFFLNTQDFFLRVAPSTVDSLVLKPSEDGLQHWLRRDTQPARGIRSSVFTSGFMILKPINVPEFNWMCCHFSAETCNIMQYYDIIHCFEIARFCVLLALTGICVFSSVCLWRLWCCCCYCCVFCVKSVNSFSCLDCCF